MAIIGLFAIAINTLHTFPLSFSGNAPSKPGRVGAGKSSLINALRGLQPNEAEAASVGVGHTTKRPKPYSFTGELANLAKTLGFVAQDVFVWSWHMTSRFINLRYSVSAEAAYILGLTYTVSYSIPFIPTEPLPYQKWKTGTQWLGPTSHRFGVHRPRNMARLWDLPGAGTKDWPTETYICDAGLRHFDGVLLVVAGAFSDAEETRVER